MLVEYSEEYSEQVKDLLVGLQKYISSMDEFYNKYLNESKSDEY
jgi:hypothetical protein